MGRSLDNASWTILDALLRRSALVISILAVIVIVTVPFGSSRTDWQYFRWGSDMLFDHHGELIVPNYATAGDSPGAFHIYASYPFLQIGPFALLVAAAITRISSTPLAGGIFIMGLGLVTVVILIRGHVVSDRRQECARLIAATAAVTVWGDLARFGHLDDALALSLAVAGTCLLRRHHVIPGSILLGLAPAAKPWALGAIALVAVLPELMDRLRALMYAGSTLACCWAPFVLTDSRTLELGAVKLHMQPDSPLAALGVAGIAHPTLLRMTQLTGGLLLCFFSTRKGHWAKGLCGLVALRLLLDPASYGYYDAALVATAVVADIATERRLPVLTALALVAWSAPRYIGSTSAGFVHLAIYLALVLVALRSCVERAAPLAGLEARRWKLTSSAYPPNAAVPS